MPPAANIRSVIADADPGTPPMGEDCDRGRCGGRSVGDQ